MIELSYLLIGFLLLVAGRKLFWLFVGGLGFVAGMQISTLYFGVEPLWISWMTAALLGLLGAFLAICFQTLAIGVGGFVAGFTITVYIFEFFGAMPLLVFCLAGGVLCVFLLFLAFDWALIGVSVFAGTTLIVQSLQLDQQLQIVLSAVLIVAGILFQANFLHQHIFKKP